MRKFCLVVAALAVLPLSAYSQSKPCEELKSEIAQKIEANGVKSYSLEIVAKEKEATGKIVGTCEAGTKKIVYSRSETSANVNKKSSDTTKEADGK